MFNHSQAPNVSYKLEPETESIRYTTTRDIRPDEELCIFYGHSLWFEPTDIVDRPPEVDLQDDGWGGLSHLQADGDKDVQDEPFLHGHLDDLISEEELPFIRMKLVDDEAEGELAAVQTGRILVSIRALSFL